MVIKLKPVNKMDFFITLSIIIFLLSPFFIVAKKDYPPFDTDPNNFFDLHEFEFTLHPANTFANLVQSINIIHGFGPGARILLISKAIFSIIVSYLIVSLYYRSKRPRPNSTPAGSPSKQ